MTKEEKNQVINDLAERLAGTANLYITDTSSLSAALTSKLRGDCYDKNVQLLVVKNTLLKKAMEKTAGKYDELFPALKGTSAIMFSDSLNEPAKVIKAFLKANPKLETPSLKAALVDGNAYLGHNQLETLASIKTKDELIGEIIGLLQSPMKTVIGGLINEDRKFPAEA